MIRKIIRSIGLGAGAIACGSCTTPPPDQILFNAKVVTINADLAIAEALAI